MEEVSPHAGELTEIFVDVGAHAHGMFPIVVFYFEHVVFDHGTRGLTQLDEDSIVLIWFLSTGIDSVVLDRILVVVFRSGAAERSGMRVLRVLLYAVEFDTKAYGLELIGNRAAVPGGGPLAVVCLSWHCFYLGVGCCRQHTQCS